MTIATNGGVPIIIDGKLATACACCGGWSCYAPDAGACCSGNGTCVVTQQCDCQGAGKVFQGVGTTCEGRLCAPESCADCCPAWTLPGGVGDLPSEIQVDVAIDQFSVCYVAGRQTAFGLFVFTKSDTVEYQASITLTRVLTSGSLCGEWRYAACVDNESVDCRVRLSYDQENNRCLWQGTIGYNRCLASQCQDILLDQNNLCCDSQSYGFKAGAALAFDVATGGAAVMQTECSGTTLQKTSVIRGGPFNAPLTWQEYCGRPGIICIQPGGTCSEVSPLGCPVDIPVTGRITITV